MLLDRPLNDIFGQHSKVRILRFLVQSQSQSNGREIAKAVGLSHVKAHTALRDLTGQGVVSMRSAGRAFVYWLNEDHFLVREIIRPAFEKEAGLFEYLCRIILKEASLPKPLSMILFGSFAKGGASADSDIDIVIVYPRAKNKAVISGELCAAEKKITMLFGNRLSCVPLSADEFRNKLKKKDAFIGEVIRTGRVLYGKGISELVSL